MPAKRVLSVGQCTADHGSISWVIRRQFDAEVVPADTEDDALAQLRQGAFDLVLVNRILDGNGAPGMKLIMQIKRDETLASVPVMLVSNHEEAQQQAVGVGAVPGFGKGALGQPQTVERLKKYLT